MSSKKTESMNNSSVLYRKHRPYDWLDVMGQDHIVSVLENSLKMDKIAHAYLFSGSRGTGKTSIARIFAKALGISDNDIYEIDAASNRGIDDIREIRNGVGILPLESKHKIYIIDEVHMLTKEAFNALLKTLEEPPSHAIFILATTETEKIPETVVSRCQVFTFKKPNREILKKLINKVSKKEGYILENGVSDLIALLGDGSFRDTLGILQKIIGSAKSEKINIKEVENITNAPKSEFVNNFIISLAKNEKTEIFNIINKVNEANISIKTFISLILEKLRIILILKNTNEKNKVDFLMNQVSEEDWKIMDKLANEENNNINSKMLMELLKAYEATGKTYIETLPLELSVIEIVK